jgi:hypothetical protein
MVKGESTKPASLSLVFNFLIPLIIGLAQGRTKTESF